MASLSSVNRALEQFELVNVSAECTVRAGIVAGVPRNAPPEQLARYHVTIGMAARVDGGGTPLNRAAVVAAVAWCVERHPMLRVGFAVNLAADAATADASPRVQEIRMITAPAACRDPASFVSVQARPDANAWKDVVRDACRRGFPIDGSLRPPWHVILLAGDEGGPDADVDVIVVACHALVDGVGIVRLLADLVRIAAQAATGSPIPVPVSRPAPLRQGLLRLLWPDTGLPAFLWRVLGTTALPYERSKLISERMAHPPLSGRLVPPPSTLPTYDTVYAADPLPGTLDEVAAAAKKHGLRLNAVFLAAAQFACAPWMLKGGGLTSTPFQVYITANFRNRTAVPFGNEDIGNSVMIGDFSSPLALGTTFWQCARQCQSGSDFVTQPWYFGLSAYVFSSLLSTVEDLVRVLSATQYPGAFSGTFGLSNLGPVPGGDAAFPGDQGTAQRIVQAFLYQHSGSALALGFPTLFVTTVGKRCMWSMSYPTEVVPTALAQALIDAVQRLVADAATQPEAFTVGDYVRNCDPQLLCGHPRACST